MDDLGTYVFGTICASLNAATKFSNTLLDRPPIGAVMTIGDTKLSSKSLLNQDRDAQKLSQNVQTGREREIKR